MSEFIVSARKYRPQDWQDVVGQNSISDTLDNAINQEKLAHAYLFCGPRGVGKTTCARIFAKKINASELTDSGEDFAFNVFELDAASNNSVEDIRNLTDQVRIPPQKGQYKVYIIDEVHMLSTQAFNAFLKTLEEPPAHAIFILATTEKHKILPTILSRCQVYDFNRISVLDIAAHLKNIADKESITYEEEGLVAIAKKADGALRDALSIFDQVASFSSGNITYKEVADNLSILDHEFYFKLSEAINEENIQKSVLSFHDILNQGFDGHQFLLGLSEHLRNMIMATSTDTLKLIETSETVRQQYQDHIKDYPIAIILQALDLIGKADSDYRMSQNKRLLVELCLMQLCSLKANQKKKPYNLVEIIPPNGIPIDPDLKEVLPQGVSTSNAQSEVQGSPQDLPNKVDVKSSELKAFKPKPKPPSEAKKPPKAAFSINKAMSGTYNKDVSGKQAIQENSNILEKLNEPVDQSIVENSWKKYAYQIKQRGQETFFSTLTIQKPVLTENNIHFIIANAAQKEILDSHRSEMLEFLRKDMRNHYIQLTWEMKEAEIKANLYTPAQKFNKMAENNPTLNKLKQKFDLDIDF